MALENLPDLMAEIGEADSFKAVCRIFEKSIEPLGVRYYGIGPLTGVPPKSMFAAAEAPEHWVDHYVNSGLSERDPLVRAARDGRSFRWDEIELHDEADIAAYNETRSSGMAEGYATTVAGPGAMKAGVTLSGDGINNWNVLQQVQAKVLGDVVLQRALILNDLTWRAAMPFLSPVEKRLLELASEGNVDKEIGLIMNISYKRVHEMWRAIRRKLGAKDRANAASIAVAIGLISPPSRAVQLVFGYGDPN
ncbi:MAG: autoinducer binding domain-containing protein [Caulobacterales bacterium]